MVVLSPLLDLVGFYQPRFEIETETPIKISAEDDGVIVKGNIDVLVVQRQLWILVVESKATKDVSGDCAKRTRCAFATICKVHNILRLAFIYAMQQAL